MNLTVNIPTRGRPEALKTTLERTLPNVVRSDTTILVSIDDDDEETLKVLGSLPSECVYSIKPREDTRGPKCDRALTEAPAGVYLIGHDCAPIITHGFDQMVVDAAWNFPDGIGCVTGPMANGNFTQFQAPTAKLVELMGYIYHPGFPFWFIDHWLDDVMRMVGRYWMVPVELDHIATRPSKTIGLRDLVFWANYFDALVVERREQADRILSAMDEPHWRKRMMRDSWPVNRAVVEFRSQIVNDWCRANAAGIEADRGGEAPTEAYMRAKRAAVDHMVRLAG